MFQNKALKVVVGAYYRDSVKSIFANLQIIQIELFEFEIARFVFKCNCNSTPISFSNFFKKTSKVSNVQQGTQVKLAIFISLVIDPIGHKDL